MAIKITKTLYVGLGGTGVKSILRTKQCFIDAYGEVPPMVAFLAIDTDKAIRHYTLRSRTGEVVSLNDNEICLCGIDTSAVAIYNNQVAKFSWLPKRNVNNLSGLQGNGAGAIRSNGRFLIRYNAAPISNALQGKVSQVASSVDVNCPYQFDKNINGAEYPTLVNIVGSVAGGTGSGTIIDMLILAANALGNEGANKVNIRPWIVLPEVFDLMNPGPASANVFQNSYGALRELDYLFHLPTSNMNPLDFGFAKVNCMPECIKEAYIIQYSGKK